MASAEPETTEQPKWENKVTAKLRGATADEVWPLLEDFFSLHRWHPGIDTCRPVEGGGGKLRYCASTLPADGCVRWCHEKLLDVDPNGRWLSYEMADNNMGFKEYKATITVSPVTGDDEAADGGGECTIEWSFLADPIKGWSCEDFVHCLDINLQGMAKNMQTALESLPRVTV